MVLQFSFICLIVFSGGSAEILGVPPNNHGKEAIILVGEQEETLTANNLKLTLPILSTEWSLELSFKLSPTPGGNWCNILHFTQNGNQGSVGDRIPAVYWRTSTKSFTVSLSMNGNVKEVFNPIPDLVVDQTYNMELHHRYASGGVYKFSIFVNGEMTDTQENTQARQLYDVKAYIGGPFSLACQGKIKNVKWTNFL
ncbi:uncharacterized protein [Clytia hemisphaerica]|uniref:Cnidarian restricted protein n=1 Tax=Clytia hemisphaerica TaxID=252671 RepID=A0A7M5XG55_9CNID|eukprot:TCONS_00061949-protein